MLSLVKSGLKLCAHAQTKALSFSLFFSFQILLWKFFLQVGSGYSASYYILLAVWILCTFDSTLLFCCCLDSGYLWFSSLFLLLCGFWVPLILLYLFAVWIPWILQSFCAVWICVPLLEVSVMRVSVSKEFVMWGFIHMAGYFVSHFYMWRFWCFVVQRCWSTYTFHGWFWVILKEEPCVENQMRLDVEKLRDQTTPTIANLWFFFSIDLDGFFHLWWWSWWFLSPLMMILMVSFASDDDLDGFFRLWWWSWSFLSPLMMILIVSFASDDDLDRFFLLWIFLMVSFLLWSWWFLWPLMMILMVSFASDDDLDGFFLLWIFSTVSLSSDLEWGRYCNCSLWQTRQSMH